MSRPFPGTPCRRLNLLPPSIPLSSARPIWMDVRVVYSSCDSVSGPVLNSCLKRPRKPSRSCSRPLRQTTTDPSIDREFEMGMQSYLRPLYVTVDTGATTTAVPVQNTSSASIRSSMEMGHSSTCSARPDGISVVSCCWKLCVRCGVRTEQERRQTSSES